MVQILLKNAFREPSLMPLPLHHQRKLKQHWQMLRSLGNECRGDTHNTSCTQESCKEKNQSKEGQKVNHEKSRKQYRGPQVMKMMLVMKMKTLKIVIKQFAPSLMVYGEIT